MGVSICFFVVDVILGFVGFAVGSVVMDFDLVVGGGDGDFFCGGGGDGAELDGEEIVFGRFDGELEDWGGKKFDSVVVDGAEF